MSKKRRGYRTVSVYQFYCPVDITLGFLYFSIYDGSKINNTEYSYCLKELVDICVLCNDSSLSYNEVIIGHVIVT